MRRLKRDGLNLPPAGWDQKVDAAFPNKAAFDQKAAEFEQLDIDDDDRQQGFKKFGGHTMAQTSSNKPTWKTLWSSVKAVKDELDKMSDGRCAYCEQLINARRSGQVEHFKPKSLFPTLTYDVDNYFLACNGCNGAKSDKWPDDGTSYIRPDEGQPSRRFTFTEDGRIKANIAGSESETTIKDFELGRGGLVRARKVAIAQTIGTLKDLLDEPAIPVDIKRRLVRKQIRRVQSQPTGYSTAIVQVIRETWSRALPNDRL
ncbi:TIGR02646 family protein [bacterium]|nr:TIGR02646 family protein [bacterium]